MTQKVSDDSMCPQCGSSKKDVYILGCLPRHKWHYEPESPIENAVKSETVSPANAEWLIWSLDHKTWFGPNMAGYTRVIADAGRYTYEKARSIMNARDFRCGSTLPTEEGCFADLMVPAPEFKHGS